MYEISKKPWNNGDLNSYVDDNGAITLACSN